jgi:CDP-diacylglycerol---glycerol-3-phosphate 3-phosphatidyltransferase
VLNFNNPLGFEERRALGIYSTKPRWQKWLQPIVSASVQFHVSPDAFTYGALALSLLAGLALGLAGANTWTLWVVPVCVLLRLIFNLLDGLVARAAGVADTLGELKNEFGDRLADAAIFLGLIFGGYVDPRLASIALILILLSSYLGILSKALGGPRLYTGVFAKGDRMITLALFTLYPALSGNLVSFNWYLGFAACAAGITILQRLRGIHGNTQPIS